MNALRLAGEYHWLNAVPSAAVGSELDDVAKLSWLFVRLFQSCTIADDDNMIGDRNVPVHANMCELVWMLVYILIGLGRMDQF